tara:strand:- start:5828 stop:6043 length:216 start_codon:yes stop_codon:yes gene_type:complete
MSIRNWSNDSQQYTQFAILESQIQKKDETINKLKAQIECLTSEKDRLQSLVDVLTGIKENLNTGDIMDRFK